MRHILFILLHIMVWTGLGWKYLIFTVGWQTLCIINQRMPRSWCEDVEIPEPKRLEPEPEATVPSEIDRAETLLSQGTQLLVLSRQLQAERKRLEGNVSFIAGKLRDAKLIGEDGEAVYADGFKDEK